MASVCCMVATKWLICWTCDEPSLITVSFYYLILSACRDDRTTIPPKIQCDGTSHHHLVYLEFIKAIEQIGSTLPTLTDTENVYNGTSWCNSLLSAEGRPWPQRRYDTRGWPRGCRQANSSSDQSAQSGFTSFRSDVRSTVGRGTGPVIHKPIKCPLTKRRSGCHAVYAFGIAPPERSHPEASAPRIQEGGAPVRQIRLLVSIIALGSRPPTRTTLAIWSSIWGFMVVVCIWKCPHFLEGNEELDAQSSSHRHCYAGAIVWWRIRTEPASRPLAA